MNKMVIACTLCFLFSPGLAKAQQPTATPALPQTVKPLSQPTLTAITTPPSVGPEMFDMAVEYRVTEGQEAIVFRPLNGITWEQHRFPNPAPAGVKYESDLAAFLKQAGTTEWIIGRDVLVFKGHFADWKSSATRILSLLNQQGFLPERSARGLEPKDCTANHCAELVLPPATAQTQVAVKGGQP